MFWDANACATMTRILSETLYSVDKSGSMQPADFDIDCVVSVADSNTLPYNVDRWVVEGHERLISAVVDDYMDTDTGANDESTI